MTPADDVDRCLARTRSAVLNVLLAAAAGIAATGVVLRDRVRGAADWPPTTARTACLSALLTLVVASYATRRVVAGRESLRDPATRAGRFRRGHILSAALGLLAVPLGFVYGYAVEPRLGAVAPYWVAALGLGALAWPRGRELADFDEPMSLSPAEPDR